MIETLENNGKLAQFSYDAWGRMCRTNNWTNYYSDITAIPYFDILERGYTGHEHIRQFDLINMNARVYDPLLGCFLSPDNEVTDPENPQNYNRFSYALNNPLIYTDPSGNNHIAMLFMMYGIFNTITQTAVNWGKYGADAGLQTLGMNLLASGISYGVNCGFNSFMSANTLYSLLSKSLVSSCLTGFMSSGKYTLEAAVSSIGFSLFSWSAEVAAEGLNY